MCVWGMSINISSLTNQIFAVWGQKRVGYDNIKIFGGSCVCFGLVLM